MSEAVIPDLVALRQFVTHELEKWSEEKVSTKIIGLVGDLGAGKTALVQQLAHVVGVEEAVTSPTYLIMRSYKTTHPHFHTLVHIDAYRIVSLDELVPLRLAEVLRQPHTLVCIEWADQIKDALPATTQFYYLTPTLDDTRLITTK